MNLGFAIGTDEATLRSFYADWRMVETSKSARERSLEEAANYSSVKRREGENLLVFGGKL